MRRIYCLSALIFVATFSARAAVIKGRILDESGEPATGAVIQVANSGAGDAAGLDGSFLLKGLAAGHYSLTVSLLAYEQQTKEVDIRSESDELVLDFRLVRQSRQLQEAVVTAKNTGGSDAGARQMEQRADNVVNILSARSIQLLPDVTVANVLRRVSGVTVDRSADGGEGRYPVIRGMDRRYNYTLINGIKIPSPDDKNRYVPMDIFPSEILQRLEVVKALTADMEGDAIGGAMNLVMRDAPEDRTIQAQAAVGYAQQVLNNRFTKYDHSSPKQSPAEANGGSYNATYADFSKSNLDFKKTTPLPDAQLNLTIGNRFLKRRLGLIFSGSYQSSNRNGTEAYFEPNAQPDPVPHENTPAFSSFQYRNYSTHNDRIGLHGKADYLINSRNKISLYGLMMKLNSYQTRYTVDTLLSSTARTMPGVGQVELHSRSRTQLQSIYNATLQGDHKLSDHFSADWSAVYSLAAQQTPDEAELFLTQEARIDSVTHSSVASAPAGLKINRFWQHNRDQDLAGYANLHYTTSIGTGKLLLSLGGMYRHKDRDNYFNQYLLSAASSVAFTNIYDASFGFYKGSPQGSQTGDANIYTATEDISAGYLSARWERRRLQVLGGLRLEHTDQAYDQPVQLESVAGKSATLVYTDLLPDLHFKYSLNSREAVRLSYFKAISRPGYFELVPAPFPGDDYIETGNYNLKHSKADNIDLRWERFPGGADQILAGIFYKKIDNAIGYVYDRQSSTTILKPDNIGTATNFGAEIVYTKYFRRFGVSFNYTYTYSDVPDQKKVYYKIAYQTPTGSATKDTIRFETEHIPLQGQAAHIGNLSLIYRDSRRGTELQLAAVYTGRHIVYVSPYYGLDYWARGLTILDLSGEQRLSRHFSLYLKLNNLLNTATIVELMHSNPYTEGLTKIPEQTRDDRILVDKRRYGQSYLVGFRYHL